MKILGLIAILFIGVAQELDRFSDTPRENLHIEQFKWLEGTWQNMKSLSYEQWEFNAETSTWEGRGFQVNNVDTLITEKLIIECEESVCDYIADVPHNLHPIRFRISDITTSGFKAVNPDHNFPKYIHYNLLSDDRFNAAIGAEDRKIKFQFIRYISK